MENSLTFSKLDIALKKLKGKKSLGPDHIANEPVHEISNNVVCATSKASDQPVHAHSLIRAFASRLSIV